MEAGLCCSSWKRWGKESLKRTVPRVRGLRGRPHKKEKCACCRLGQGGLASALLGSRHAVCSLRGAPSVPLQDRGAIWGRTGPEQPTRPSRHGGKVS